MAPYLGGVIGIDLGKNPFHLHAADAQGRRVLRRCCNRTELIALLSTLEPCLIGMEACAGAHHWARTLRRLGHEVRLINPQLISKRTVITS